MTQKKRGFAAMKSADRKAAARKGGMAADAKKTGSGRERRRTGEPTAEAATERKTSGRRMATAEDVEMEREREE